MIIQGGGNDARALLDTIASAADESGRAAVDKIRAAILPPVIPDHQPSAEGGVVDLAERVRSRVLSNTGFPSRLSTLATLPLADARALVADLVEAILTADASFAVLTTATERLSQVVDVVNRPGRHVTADPPPLPLSHRPGGSAEWCGALLALLDPAAALRLALPELTANDDRVRRTALHRLTAVAQQLGRPSLPLPGPGAADDVYVRLFDLLSPVLLPDAPTRRGHVPAPPEDRRVLSDLHLPDLWPPTDIPPPAPPPRPTRTVYARLDAPEVAPPAQVFELRVGLAAHGTTGVIQDAPFAVPVAAFTLEVTVIAPGFRLLGGESWRRVMEASPEDPYPYHVMRVVPRYGFAADRTLTAEYAVAGRVIGYATRVVRVGVDAAETPAATSTPEPGAVWVLPANEAERPDLEITIARGNDTAGSGLVWLVRSRHPGVVPEHGLFSSHLDRPEDGSKEFIRGIENRKASADLGEYLDGFSIQIGEAVPGGVVDALRAVAAVADGPPTVLLASWEPYVPWELAHVPDRWDTTAPPLLGAQSVLGRWTYSKRMRSAGPPPTLELAAMGVVSGDYEGRLSLPHAEQEAADIRAQYSATTVDARTRPILDCLGGDPPLDTLHFALHGSSGTAGTNEGLMMADRSYLGSTSVKGVGVRLDGRPSGVRTVFLNACQLGQGRALFGEYAGMAAALIGLGVGAVVAPQWKVDDEVAREVAEEFYEAVFIRGMRPAEQLRQERVATRGKEGLPAGTRLAYVYFGHPCLRVTWNGPRGEDHA